MNGSRTASHRAGLHTFILIKDRTQHSIATFLLEFFNFLKEILSLQQSTELNLQLQHICIWRLWRYWHETFKCRSPFLNMDRCLTDKWPAPRLPLTLAVAGSNACDLSVLHGFVTLQSQKSGLQYTRMHARTHAHKLTLSQSLLGRTTDLELGVYPPQWNAVIRKPSHNCRLRHIHNTCMHLQTHRKIAVLSFISNMKYENYTPATCKILNHFCSRVFMALHACIYSRFVFCQWSS